MSSVILAERPNKKIYRDDNRVYKVFDKSFPKVNVLNEAINQARVEETGLPIPKVLGVTLTDDGSWTIIQEYIEGKTLAQLMSENPDRMDEYMKDFVDLQILMHSKTAPTRLNKLKDKMDERIVACKDLSATVRYELRTRLEGMPKHKKVLHGDFNPTNVVRGNDGRYYILDWAHATQGNASADAAITYLLFTLQEKTLADKYLRLFCDRSDTAKQYVQSWLPIVAAARKVRAVPEEQAILDEWLNVVEYE